jgi:hypothetical protein
MSNFFWYPKRYHAVSRETLQKNENHGGLDFPHLQVELAAYITETIAIAIRHPEKQWVGMLRYTMGDKLKDLLPTIKNEKHSAKQKKTSTLMRISLITLESRVKKWQDMDVKKLKKMLMKPETGKTEIWKNIKNSSRSYRRVDLNYLIAHDRLPLGAWLHSKKITDDEKCRLCRKHTETRKHLFFDCEKIQVLKNETIRDMTYDALIWHTPKLPNKYNELLSVYKQCIWQTRAAIYYEHITDIQSYMRKLMLGKTDIDCCAL